MELKTQILEISNYLSISQKLEQKPDQHELLSRVLDTNIGYE